MADLWDRSHFEKVNHYGDIRNKGKRATHTKGLMNFKYVTWRLLSSDMPLVGSECNDNVYSMGVMCQIKSEIRLKV